MKLVSLYIDKWELTLPTQQYEVRILPNKNACIIPEFLVFAYHPAFPICVHKNNRSWKIS